MKRPTRSCVGLAVPGSTELDGVTGRAVLGRVGSEGADGASTSCARRPACLLHRLRLHPRHLLQMSCQPLQFRAAVLPTNPPQASPHCWACRRTLAQATPFSLVATLRALCRC
eukprot:6882778-Alexandrium_andersonii.AAC.1